MAPMLPPLTIIQVTCKGQQENGSASFNVFNWFLYRETGSVDGAAILPEITKHLHDLWYDVRDVTPGVSRWDEAELKYSIPGTQVWVDWTTITLGYTGNDTGDALPSGVSACVTGPTSTPKRRARKFLPPFGETYSKQQQWTAGALTKLVTWAARWVTGIDMSSLNAWIYPIALNAVTWAWTALSSARANAVPAYQRRRKPGVGI